MTITVKTICNAAISDTTGIALRKQILYVPTKNKEKIILDFSGIKIFSAVFFESSLVFLALQYPDVFARISIENMQDYAEKMLNHIISCYRELDHKKIKVQDYRGRK